MTTSNLNTFEQRRRDDEATGTQIAVSEALRAKMAPFRLVLARLGGDPMRTLDCEELEAAVNEHLAELRGATAAVGWERGVEVWARMKPRTAEAVREQFAYLSALAERDAA